MMARAECRKFPSLLIFVYCYGKAIGLCPVALDDGGFLKYSHAGIFYSIILCFSYLFLFYRAIVDRAGTTYPNETLISIIIAALVVSVQFILIIFSWIFFALHQRKLIFILEEFERTGELSRKLGIEDDPWESVRTFCCRMVFVNAGIGGMYFAEVCFYSSMPMFEWKIWLPYNFPHIIIHNLLVLFITAVETLKRRFRRLNLQLRNLPLISQRKEILPKNTPNRMRTDVPQNSDTCPNSVSLNIEAFGNLHGELSELSNVVTDFFALVILMALMTSFLQTLSNSYYLCLHLTDIENIKDFEIILNANCMFWLTVVVLEFFFIAVVSGTICDEANNTSNELWKMWVYYRPQNCEKTMKKISLQLLQRKLSISLYGFISLDYHFIYRICGTVTTYLIIMLQLEDLGFKTKNH